MKQCIEQAWLAWFLLRAAKAMFILALLTSAALLWVQVMRAWRASVLSTA